MRIEVTISPQFDFCYAFAEMIAPDTQRGPNWWFRRRRMPSWLPHAQSFGWSYWLALPDVLEAEAPCRSIEQFLEDLRALPSKLFVRRIKRGLFHTGDATEPPVKKREWLHFIGLDVGKGKLPTQRVLEGAAPDIHRQTVCLLERFAKVFEPVWIQQLPALESSARKLRREVRTKPLEELVGLLGLPVEIDKRKRSLRALRGGYELKLSAIGTVYLVPSLFNFRRLWTTSDETLPAIVYFPYSAGLVPGQPGVSDAPAAPIPVDPWLVCRAVGDPTRAAILRRIAERPQPARDLIQALGISKATMSHHVFQLREAGLIREARLGRTVELSLCLGPLDALSSAFRGELSNRRSTLRKR